MTRPTNRKTKMIPNNPEAVATLRKSLADVEQSLIAYQEQLRDEVFNQSHDRFSVVFVDTSGRAPCKRVFGNFVPLHGTTPIHGWIGVEAAPHLFVGVAIVSEVTGKDIVAKNLAKMPSIELIPFRTLIENRMAELETAQRTVSELLRPFDLITN